MMKKLKLKKTIIFIVLSIFVLLVMHQIILIITEINAAIHFRNFDGKYSTFTAKEATNFEWDEAFYSRDFMPIQQWHKGNGKADVHTFGRHSILTGALQFFKANKLVMSMPLNIGELLFEQKPYSFFSPETISPYPDLFRFTPDTVLMGYGRDFAPVSDQEDGAVIVRGNLEFDNLLFNIEHVMNKQNSNKFILEEAIRSLSWDVYPNSEISDVFVAKNISSAKQWAEQLNLEWNCLPRYSVERMDVSYVCLICDGEPIITSFYNDKLKFAESITTLSNNTLLHGEYDEKNEILYITLAQ